MMDPESFTDIQHPKKRAFLAAYSRIGNITRAAEAVGMHRGSHLVWLKKDPEYASAFEEARGMAGDRLEAEARRRAVEGTDEPIFYQGVQVGTVKRYSDVLLICLLKAHRPEKFAERSDIRLQGRMQHTGQVQVFIPDNSRGDSDPAQGDDTQESLPSPDPS